MEVVHLLRIKDNFLPAPLIRIPQNQGKIHFALAVCQVLLHLQKFCPAHQLIYPAHTQLRHILPQLLGDEPHKVLHIFGLSRKASAKFRVLGCHAHRAGVQIADAHHQTSQGHKRRSGKAKLLRSENRSDGHIPSAHQLPVRLDADFVSKTVLDQRLVGLRQSKLPGQSRVMDGIAGRSPRAAVIAAYQYHLCPRFRHTCCHRSNTRLGNELHRNPRPGIGIFQIVN